MSNNYISVNSEQKSRLFCFIFVLVLISFANIILLFNTANIFVNFFTFFVPYTKKGRGFLPALRHESPPLVA